MIEIGFLNFVINRLNLKTKEKAYFCGVVNFS